MATSTAMAKLYSDFLEKPAKIVFIDKKNGSAPYRWDGIRPVRHAAKAGLWVIHEIRARAACPAAADTAPVRVLHLYAQDAQRGMLRGGAGYSLNMCFDGRWPPLMPHVWEATRLFCQKEENETPRTAAGRSRPTADPAIGPSAATQQGRPIDRIVPACSNRRLKTSGHWAPWPMAPAEHHAADKARRPRSYMGQLRQRGRRSEHGKRSKMVSTRAGDVVDRMSCTDGCQPQCAPDRPKPFNREKGPPHHPRSKIIPQFAGLFALRQQAGNASAGLPRRAGG